MHWKNPHIFMNVLWPTDIHLSRMTSRLITPISVLKHAQLFFFYWRPSFIMSNINPVEHVSIASWNHLRGAAHSDCWTFELFKKHLPLKCTAWRWTAQSVHVHMQWRATCLFFFLLLWVVIEFKHWSYKWRHPPFSWNILYNNKCYVILSKVPRLNPRLSLF